MLLSILLFLLIIGLLFVPVELYIDTTTNDYYFRLRGLLRADLETHEKELIRVRLDLIFGNVYFYPLRKIGLSQKGRAKKDTERRKGKRMAIGKVIRLLKTFTIKKMVVDVDTGDCLLNAKLYPAFVFLNHTAGQFSINFQGRNHFVLSIQNRPLNIIKSFINL
ncbi:hypothetical protein [Ulvibacterium sp.]|uniref:hypothetical protein n=1 Tax=Ulvibacterium sp. TaxID=2665914 RepID=UPI003BA93DED